MKNKTILSLTGLSLLLLTTFTNCSTSEQRVQEAESDVIDSNEELNEINEEYLKDLENYRIETALLLSDNEQKIADLKEKMKADKSLSNAQTIVKMQELEQKNAAMKAKLVSYNDKGNTKWEKFKLEFNHDMEELGKAFKSIGTNDVK